MQTGRQTGRQKMGGGGDQVALHERAQLEVVHRPGVPRVWRQSLQRRRDEGWQQALHQRLTGVMKGVGKQAYEAPRMFGAKPRWTEVRRDFLNGGRAGSDPTT